MTYQAVSLLVTLSDL